MCEYRFCSPYYGIYCAFTQYYLIWCGKIVFAWRNFVAKTNIRRAFINSAQLYGVCIVHVTFRTGVNTNIGVLMSIRDLPWKFIFRFYVRALYRLCISFLLIRIALSDAETSNFSSYLHLNGIFANYCDFDEILCAFESIWVCTMWRWHNEQMVES